MLQIPKNSFDIFVQFLRTLGGNVSVRLDTDILAVCVMGEDILTVSYTPGVVYEVKSTNVQALAQIKHQWAGVLPKLKEKTDE